MRLRSDVMRRYLTFMLGLTSMIALSLAAHGQMIDLKVGIHRNDQVPAAVLVAAESRMGERLSFQPEFGFATQFRNLGGYSSIHSYHLGIEGRGYLLLRQDQYFCGLYSGIFVAHSRVHGNAPGYASNVFRRYGTSGGILLGYQQAFRDHFRVDGGLKLGYRKGLWTEQRNAAGGIIDKELHGHNVAGYLYLQVGYAF
jgi:hypothetical protein